MFSVRIVSTDHYMSAPIPGLDVQYAEHRGSEVKKVPVVRIFGATPAGQKTCMHVHGVFPYLYVPYDGTLPWDRYLRQFATSLDKAINVAQGYGQSKIEHVYKIVLVTGRSMYGYHDKEQQFLKIYLYNPSMIRKAADLLLGGAVLNKPFQPHESHIPYTLQLFIDYNLYGMNMINVGAVKFRRQLDQESALIIPSQESDEGGGPQTPISFTGLLNRSGSMTPSQRVWGDENIPSELYLSAKVEKLSTCELEVDVVAADILNRLEVGDNIGANPGLTALWEDERQRRRERGESTDIAPPNSQDRGDVPTADSELELIEQLKQIVKDLQPYMDSQADSDSDISQDDLPLTQASELQLHLSQGEGDVDGSQDTVMLDEDDDRDVEPVVNVESIHRIVSASQSFCDVKPDVLRVSSQDRSLVDILASLADDTSLPASQHAEQEVCVLEEHDSVLSQVSEPRSQDVDKAEQEEILEMSQRVWDADHIQTEETEHDIAGMDDTWVESQIEEAGPSHITDTGCHGDDDSDSDAMSDIIPQYDGGNDEKGAMKSSSAKRLGMTGPAYSMSPRHNSPGSLGPSDPQNNMAAVNPFSDSPQQSFSHVTNQSMWPQQGHQVAHQSSQQQWMGSYGPRANSVGPRAPVRGPMHPQHPSLYPQPRMPAGNPYGGYPGAIGGGMMPGFPGQSGPHSMYGGANMGSSPQGHSPVRGQRSPIQGQMSPIHGGQMSPRSYQSQGHLTPESQGFPYSQQQSPQFIATPIHSSGTSPSQNSPSNFPPPTSIQHSQVNQRLQAAIHNKNSKRHASGHVARNAVSMNPVSMGQQPGLSPDIHPPGSMFQQMQQPNPGYGGYNQPLSVMTSAETSTRDSYPKSINFTSHAQARSAMASTMMNTAQMQSAMDSGHNLDLSNVKQFAKSPGYLLKGLQDPMGNLGVTGSTLSMIRNEDQVGNESLFDEDNILQTSLQQQTHLSQSSVPGMQSNMNQVHNPLSQGNAHFSQQMRSEPGNNFPVASQTSSSNLMGILTNSVAQQMTQRSNLASASPQLPPNRLQGPRGHEPSMGPIARAYAAQKASQNRTAAQYEQISPPVTPMASPNATKASAQSSTPSPSATGVNTHLSPLQRLLLDPLPATPEQAEHTQRSRSRGSASSASPMNSDHQKGTSSKSPHDKSTFSPPGPRKGIESSKLYTLLAQEKLVNTTPPKTSPSQFDSSNLSNPGSLQASLDDSQQDLFAELDSHNVGSTGNSNTEIDDSLVSLFSGDISVKPIEDETEPAQHLANSFGVSGNNSEKNETNAATLSGLEHFVASVRKGNSDFGVDFNKRREMEKFEKAPYMSQMSNSSVRSVDSMPGLTSIPASQPTDLHHYPMGSPQHIMPLSHSGIHQTNSPQQFQESQVFSQQQQMQQHQQMQMNRQNSSPYRGFSNWPQQNNPDGKPVKKPRGEPGKRGRPRLNKSQSLPNGQLGDMGKPLKRKRGRPKKTSEIGGTSHQQLQQQLAGGGANTMQQSIRSPNQQFNPNCFGTPGSMDMPSSVTSNLPLFGRQQSFQQLLEGEPADFLAELNAVDDLPDQFTNTGVSQSTPMGGHFQTLPSLNENVSAVTVSGSSSINASVMGNFGHEINQTTTMSRSEDQGVTSPRQYMPYQQVPQPNHQQHFSQQHYHQHPFQQQQHHPQNHQHNQYLPQQPFNTPVSEMPSGVVGPMMGMSDQQSPEFNLSQAMDISEPAVNFDTSLDSSLFVRDPTQTVNEYTVNHNVEPIVGRVQNDTSKSQKLLTKLIGEKKKQLSNNKKNKLVLAFGQGGNGTPDISSLMELIRYRQKSAPNTSPHYTFRFTVPTPVFKRLKFILRTSEHSSETKPPEVVRMHPKDARKYSLLKIGREVIKLNCLSEDKIEEIKERIRNREEVTAIPPAIREAEFANIPIVHDSIIADLLADSPSRDGIIEMSGVESVLSESLPNENINQLNTVKGQEGAEKFQKRQRKNSVMKEKNKDFLFKGNISNVPHLKKFRQGFQYFGKGHVGRGAPIVKVRQNHPGLPQELEDDENIVLKDVSLNDASDGILTPIKSRTPIAGRSPAHAGGTIGEIDQDKGLLDTKLEDLKYDLDLNQSGNAQMFQDALFSEKDMDKESFADADAANSEEEDIEMEEKIESENPENSDKADMETETGTNITKEDGNTQRSKSVSSENELKHEHHCDLINIKSEFQNVEKTLEHKVRENGIQSDLKDNLKALKVDGARDDRINLFEDEKLYLQLHLHQLASGKNEDIRTCEPEDGSVVKDNLQNITSGYRRRSSSSSIESHSYSSRGISRANSVPAGGEDIALETTVGALKVVKRRHTIEFSDDGDQRCKRLSSSNSSSAPGSRKGSRSSSLDTKQKNNRKSKSKKPSKSSRHYRYDSDSDGIPGVDYIVTNRFKGQKELRVVVSKLDIDSVEKYLSDSDKKRNGFISDHIVDRASSAESEVRNKCESEGDVKKYLSKPLTGFSAEFEKFLAQNSAPIEVDSDSGSDTEDCDIPNVVQVKSGIKERMKTHCTGGNGPKNGKNIGGPKFGIKAIAPKLDVDCAGDRVEIKCELENGKITETIKEEKQDDSENMKNEETTTTVYHSGDVDHAASCFKKAVLQSKPGGKDFSSSSDDEEFVNRTPVGPKSYHKRQQAKAKSEARKKKTPNKLHDGRAFCTKRRKRQKGNRSTKLMCTLSVLHDATLEKLTSSQIYSDMDTSSSNQSPCKYQSTSDVDSPLRPVKTPDFELYTDRSDDHKTLYEDTMYKLAYLSPLPSESETLSPPRPLSPPEMSKLDGTTESVEDRTNIEHKEQKMTLSDILRSMKNENESTKDSDTTGERSNDMPDTHSKTVVAKTTALTFEDIKLLCRAEIENESKQQMSDTEVGYACFPMEKDMETNSPVISNPLQDIHVDRIDQEAPPPDLGPPVCHSAVTLQDKPDDCSPPPQLTPNRQISSSSEISIEGDEMYYGLKASSVASSNIMSPDNNSPPVLFPCRSPKGMTMQRRLSSSGLRCAHISDMVEKGDFMTPLVEQELKMRTEHASSLHGLMEQDKIRSRSNEHASSLHGLMEQDTIRLRSNEHTSSLHGLMERSRSNEHSSSVYGLMEQDKIRSGRSDEHASSLHGLMEQDKIRLRSNEHSCSLHGQMEQDKIRSRSTEHSSSLHGPMEQDKIRSGRSPGNSSSSGSINVIHSEEFSDISDENEAHGDHRHKKLMRKKILRQTMSTAGVHSVSEQHSEIEVLKEQFERERKLREIDEFEKRLHEKDQIHEKDQNKNNIFDLMSTTGNNTHMKPVEYSSHLSQSFDKTSTSQVGQFQRDHLNNKFMGGNFSLPQELQGSRNHPTILHNTGIPNAHQNHPPDFPHMNHNSHSSNGDYGYYGNRMPHRNGAYQRSFSQNDSKLEHLMKLSVNGNGLTYNGTRQDPRDFRNAKLNLSYPSANGYYDSKGRHQMSPRNFFGNFDTDSGNIVKNMSEVISERNSTEFSSDLFESSSEKSAIDLDVDRTPSFPFGRSLSDTGRSSYSIDPSSRLSESFVKSLKNCIGKERPNPNVGNTFVPVFEFGSGSGTQRKSVKRQERTGSNNSSQKKHRQSSSNISGKESGNDNDSNKGQGHGCNLEVNKDLTFGCQVITPLNPPPTQESIQESANQHGLSTIQPINAFYGNHKDLPEKARWVAQAITGLRLTGKWSQNLRQSLSDIGRPLYNIKAPGTSQRVCELEDFQSSVSSITGLKNWRTITCAGTSSISSQTGSADLFYKLDQQPALKYAITGDQSVIITPTLPPPSQKSIQKWHQGRQLYKHLKTKQHKQEQPENTVAKIETEKKEQAKQAEGMSDRTDKEKEDHGYVEKRNKRLRLNLFTGKRELISQSDSDSQPSSQEAEKMDTIEHEHIDDKTRSATSSSTTSSSATSSSTTSSIKTPGTPKLIKTSPGPEQKTIAIEESPRSTPDADEVSSLLHSTPMVRRQSSDLFETECTPITGGSLGRQEQEGAEQPGFVTPKRIRPLRRLSTNTDSTLRRAILTSQVKDQYGTPALRRTDTSQIEGPSLKNSFGFKHSQQHLQDAKALHEYQYLTILSLEVHAASRGDLKPDPEHDPIQAIFYSIFNDVPPDTGTRQETGVFIVDVESANQSSGEQSTTNRKTDNKSRKAGDPKPGPSSESVSGSKVTRSQQSDMTLLQRSGVSGVNVIYVKDEDELLHSFIDFVLRWDPDIMLGYEIQMLSWGYVLQRAATLSINLTHAISRVPSAKQSSHHSAEKDEYGADHMSEIHVAGRIVLNLWRLLRHEVTLNVYSFENVAFHVLHKRLPLHSYRSLTAWFTHRTHVHRWKVVEHYVARVKANLDIMEQLDLVGTTSEFARVFGIEFYHVLSRGSQYRVESMMLRIAKPMNYIPVSPSVHQRARMKAPECIPLTLEPQSKFYTDPVVVLDFQSLYPSIMIAYNYCFSTCLGRVNWFDKAHEGPIEFGCTSLNLEPSVIKKLSNKVTVSPNGVVFCKRSVKRGVLPLMVEEILNTRLMVKKAMSSYKDDKTLSRMLNARQLGLKLIANVTYGYTAANFSGRMPCVEVADSIVRKARETLERSIKLVEETPEWGAQVVYGDTDSMFILLKGRSKDEAFKIGHSITKAVTDMFPKPIKLRFEKVYLPCVLQTKKRYVGYMYETPDQKEPVYDAKGIETVRRDSCTAVSKILERSIKALFTTRDVSQVKAYIQQQCQKVMEGSVSLQDFIFAKEYRGMPGYKPGACVPALEIAKKNLRQDRRSEPRVGERVPYVIVYGSPGLPLIQLVRQPGDLLQDPSLRLNATYYITKQILPPLDRFLNLLGADVFSWYQEMPHSAGRLTTHSVGSDHAKKGTISQYFATSSCPVCEAQTKQSICGNCMSDPQLVCVTLNDRITRWERVYQHVKQVCGSCMGVSDEATIKTCVSLDCPVQYRRARASVDMSRAQAYRDVLEKVFK